MPKKKTTKADDPGLKVLLQTIAEGLARYEDAKLVGLLADEVKTYLNVGALVPSIISWKKPPTVRKAQKAYSTMEAHLDRIMTIQHDAKVALQLVSALEYRLIGYLTAIGDLASGSTKPKQQQVLMSAAPDLVNVKTMWAGLDDLCTQARQRISSAQDSMKQMNKLDDNLRWATERNPG